MDLNRPKTYTVSEIFYSLQGEGVRAGTANVFVRMAFCNLRCDLEPGPLSPGGFKCDTEFASGRRMTAEEILEEATLISRGCRSVIFSGGEPTLQLDAALVGLFKARDGGWYTCIETNGTRSLVGYQYPDNPDFRKLETFRDMRSILDWVTVSPKVAEHAIVQRVADELKYVRGYGQGIPKTVVSAPNKLISPAFDGDQPDPRAVRWCIDLVKDNPEWRLSVQQHKGWAIR